MHKKLVGLPPVWAEVIEGVAVFHFFLDRLIVIFARGGEGVIFRVMTTRIVFILVLPPVATRAITASGHRP
jgi:hypothetical protein